MNVSTAIAILPGFPFATTGNKDNTAQRPQPGPPVAGDARAASQAARPSPAARCGPIVLTPDAVGGSRCHVHGSDGDS